MSAQREAFEAWGADKFWFGSKRGPDGCYFSAYTEAQWEGWQAAQVAMRVDRASRVPMRVVEIMRERFSSGDDVVVFARAIEKHHGIGAKP